MDHPQDASGFISHIRSLANAKVLELGTRRSRPEFPTHHKDWAPQASWVMTDFQDGLDVDVVADAHRLSTTFNPESFDAVVACSVFEHIQRPWIAAQEIAKVLKPGGTVFVQTHQSWPIHAYPSDYWRFTTEALKTLFEDAGLTTLSAYYEFPCRIFSLRVWRLAKSKTYLNVNLVALKS